ncbi:MAG: DnaJ C-terminal domain-containing protein [Planctomycetota bacterium]
MADRDFYDVLGIARSATADEIRSAYRKLARRFHPDVNKEPDAQAKFTEVQEANDVLSDPDKRRLYDRVGRAGYSAAATAGAGPGGRPGGSGGATYSWSNVGGSRGAGRAGGGVDFDPDDLRSMFDTFFGGRAAETPFGARNTAHGPRSRGRAAPARGRDRTAEITVPFDTMVRGGKRTVRTGGASGREIDVTVPAGIADGAKLRVRGEGEPSHAGPGDLLLTVRIAAHPLWTRGRPDGKGRDGTGSEGLDLTLELPLTIGEAALGAGVEVPTPTGPVTLTVPPGTSSHARLRLRGRGISANGQAGDLYAVVRIAVPDASALDDDTRAAIAVLNTATPPQRAGEHWS